MRLRVTALFLMLFASSACSDGAGDDSENSALGACGIRTDVSGGTTIRFTGKDDSACATQHAFDTRLDAMFIGLDAKGTLELMVDGIAEGETGDDYPTRIGVTSTAKERWQGAGCLTSISEHRLIKTEDSEIGELRHHQVSGEGSCAEPLESIPAGLEPVTLAPFAFRAEFTWRD